MDVARTRESRYTEGGLSSTEPPLMLAAPPQPIALLPAFAASLAAKPLPKDVEREMVEELRQRRRQEIIFELYDTNSPLLDIGCAPAPHDDQPKGGQLRGMEVSASFRFRQRAFKL